MRSGIVWAQSSEVGMFPYGKNFRTNVQFPEEMKGQIDAARKPFGLSVAAFIRIAVSEKLSRDQVQQTGREAK